MKSQKKNIIQLHEKDNVAVVVETLQAGDIIDINGKEIIVTKDLGIGHKLALKNISKGEQIIKYGIAIGRASEDIGAGVHVHTHNLRSDYLPTYTFS
jgi:hypothetical protein